MPGLIDSSPGCVVSREGYDADDLSDFILQGNYEDCTGFMTFGPGSTYGDEGASAETLYYILTVLGILVTLAVLAAWVVYENRQLVGHVARFRMRGPATEGPPPQPGVQREEL
jgi:hypothetical protein